MNLLLSVVTMALVAASLSKCLTNLAGASATPPTNGATSTSTINSNTDLNLISNSNLNTNTNSNTNQNQHQNSNGLSDRLIPLSQGAPYLSGQRHPMRNQQYQPATTDAYNSQSFHLIGPPQQWAPLRSNLLLDQAVPDQRAAKQDELVPMEALMSHNWLTVTNNPAAVAYNNREPHPEWGVDSLERVLRAEQSHHDMFEPAWTGRYQPPPPNSQLPARDRVPPTTIGYPVQQQQSHQLDTSQQQFIASKLPMGLAGPNEQPRQFRRQPQVAPISGTSTLDRLRHYTMNPASMMGPHSEHPLQPVNEPHPKRSPNQMANRLPQINATNLDSYLGKQPDNLVDTRWHSKRQPAHNLDTDIVSVSLGPSYSTDSQHQQPVQHQHQHQHQQKLQQVSGGTFKAPTLDQEPFRPITREPSEVGANSWRTSSTRASSIATSTLASTIGGAGTGSQFDEQDLSSIAAQLETNPSLPIMTSGPPLPASLLPPTPPGGVPNQGVPVLHQELLRNPSGPPDAQRPNQHQHHHHHHHDHQQQQRYQPTNQQSRRQFQSPIGMPNVGGRPSNRPSNTSQANYERPIPLGRPVRPVNQPAAGDASRPDDLANVYERLNTPPSVGGPRKLVGSNANGTTTAGQATSDGTSGNGGEQQQQQQPVTTTAATTSLSSSPSTITENRSPLYGVPVGARTPSLAPPTPTIARGPTPPAPTTTLTNLEGVEPADGRSTVTDDILRSTWLATSTTSTPAPAPPPTQPTATAATTTSSSSGDDRQSSVAATTGGSLAPEPPTTVTRPLATPTSEPPAPPTSVRILADVATATTIAITAGRNEAGASSTATTPLQVTDPSESPSARTLLSGGPTTVAATGTTVSGATEDSTVRPESGEADLLRTSLDTNRGPIVPSISLISNPGPATTSGPTEGTTTLSTLLGTSPSSRPPPLEVPVKEDQPAQPTTTTPAPPTTTSVTLITLATSTASRSPAPEVNLFSNLPTLSSTSESAGTESPAPTPAPTPAPPTTTTPTLSSAITRLAPPTTTTAPPTTTAATVPGANGVSINEPASSAAEPAERIPSDGADGANSRTTARAASAQPKTPTTTGASLLEAQQQEQQLSLGNLTSLGQATGKSPMWLHPVPESATSGDHPPPDGAGLNGCEISVIINTLLAVAVISLLFSIAFVIYMRRRRQNRAGSSYISTMTSSRSRSRMSLASGESALGAGHTTSGSSITGGGMSTNATGSDQGISLDATSNLLANNNNHLDTITEANGASLLVVKSASGGANTQSTDGAAAKNRLQPTLRQQVPPGEGFTKL